MIKQRLKDYKKKYFRRENTFGIRVGLLLLVVIFLGVVFFPVINAEIKYLLTPKIEEAVISLRSQDDFINDKKITKQIITPADLEFSIVIPKLGINSKIIKNVDPFNEGEYLKQLKEGVAHSKTSGLPNDRRNSFIFAHSSNNFYNVGGYNSVFYLLYKLKKGDVFYLAYEGKIYKYKVTELKKVKKESVEYLYSKLTDSSVTLMTCWPPGTAQKRLLVFGKLVSVE